MQAGAGGSLPVLYPTLRLERRSVYADPPRVYKLRGTGREALRRATAWSSSARTRSASTTALQGTTWKDPPILDDADRDAHASARREYELHYDGDRLRLVAWRTPKAAYWISNTLLQTLTEKQMMAIARSARRCC